LSTTAIYKYTMTTAMPPPAFKATIKIDDLHGPEIAALMGCGAMRELDAKHCEIKSMRTAAAHLRKGVAAQLLARIIAVAQERSYQRLSLETGSTPDFAAAHAL
jgi:putative acetyltransferase